MPSYPRRDRIAIPDESSADSCSCPADFAATRLSRNLTSVADKGIPRSGMWCPTRVPVIENTEYNQKGNYRCKPRPAEVHHAVTAYRTAIVYTVLKVFIVRIS